MEGTLQEMTKKPFRPRAGKAYQMTQRLFHPYSYAFGSAGKEKFQIPPYAELRYEIHLKSFEKVSLLTTLWIQIHPISDFGEADHFSPLVRPRSLGR